jgi:hypothetical protein
MPADSAVINAERIYELTASTDQRHYPFGLEHRFVNRDACYGTVL